MLDIFFDKDFLKDIAVEEVVFGVDVEVAKAFGVDDLTDGLGTVASLSKNADALSPRDFLELIVFGVDFLASIEGLEALCFEAVELTGAAAIDFLEEIEEEAPGPVSDLVFTVEPLFIIWDNDRFVFDAVGVGEFDLEVAPPDSLSRDSSTFFILETVEILFAAVSDGFFPMSMDLLGDTGDTGFLGDTSADLRGDDASDVL